MHINYARRRAIVGIIKKLNSTILSVRYVVLNGYRRRRLDDYIGINTYRKTKNKQQ